MSTTAYRLLAGTMVALVTWVTGPTPAAADPVKPWPDILGPSQGNLPAPQPKVVWQADLAWALKEARAENRPVFVTLRCLPCKQCSDFDKDVLEGGAELDPLLKQFVTVRLTDAQQADLRLLPVEGFQDLDLSWWGWFLSPEGKVYGIFGGKDHVSDSTRISVDALTNTMRRVLAHHYDPRRPAWDIDGPAPVLAGPAIGVKNLPGWDSWFGSAPKEVKAQTCVHCHQVREVLWQPKVDAGQFDKERDWDVWPLPENVGLTLDRDHGLLVKSVEPGSAAERAGIKAGDELGAAGGRKLFGQADFRGVLHRGPAGAGSVEVRWFRDGKPMSGTLQLRDGWRDTVLDWRMSVSQGNVGGYPTFWPLPANDAKRKRHNIAPDQMALEPYFGKNTSGPAYRAGVRPGHVVVAIGGEKPNLVGRALLVWFKKRYDPGQQVTITVIDDKGQRRDISYKLPERGEG